jgi:ATP-binding cassette subfamily C (CFTR/MRP) protein 1
MLCAAPLATFVFFVVSAKYTGWTLDAASAFTSLSLIALISGPLNLVIMSIPMLNAAMACFKRIQTFLCSDARRDHRIAFDDTDSQQHFETATEGIELRRLPSSSSVAALITAQNASFSWKADGAPTVTDNTFTINRKQFCFVIGPVGSGKSTLLKGLLGETPSSKGFVYTRFNTVGYVDQTPWIQNGSVQDNILGVSTLDEDWYRKVVYVCALEQDIANMPRGHGK